jgi:hypothetical protein
MNTFSFDDNPLIMYSQPDNVSSTLTHRRRSSLTVRTEPDRRESTSRLRNAHIRQSSDMQLPFLLTRGLPPPSLTPPSRESSASPELVPFDFDSDSDDSSTGSSVSSLGKRKARLHTLSLSHQFRSLTSKPSPNRLLKCLLGLTGLVFLLSIHSVQYASFICPAISSKAYFFVEQIQTNRSSRLATISFLEKLVKSRDRRFRAIAFVNLVHSNGR